MEQNYPPWITKTMVRGVSGFNLDAYLMALEGWRRSLTLTWYYDLSKVSQMKMTGFNHTGKCFSITSKKTGDTHYFYRSRGDKVTNEAIKNSHNKYTAKQFMFEANVPTPNAVLVRKETTNEEIKSMLNDLTYPLVVKPTEGSLGKGVEVNIKTEDDVFSAIDKIRTNYEDYDELMIEEFTKGDDYRVYVVGDKIAAATNRLPANVEGDGRKTIAELIEIKNKQKENNPYLKNKQIKINDALEDYLLDQEKTLTDIPNEGEVVYLIGIANIATGGDPIDVTDELTNKIKQVAINAIKAIPGLYQAGVDLMVDGENISVLEINSTAEISMHLFPYKGKPRNVPSFIMDAYFPKTKGLSKDRTDIYFDYRKIRKNFIGHQADQITLKIAPNGKLHKARYIVSGKVQKVGYRAWIRKQAIKEDLHGYTRNLSDGRVVIIVASANKKAVENFKQICLQGSPRSKVKEIKTLGWEKPIKLGFEIKKTK